MECLLQRAALKGSTQTKHHRRDVILVKQVNSAQMVYDQYPVQLATSVNMDSPTVQPASQGSTARLDHQNAFHVQQGNSVLGLLLNL